MEQMTALHPASSSGLVSQCLVWKGHAYPWWTPHGSLASLLWDKFRDSHIVRDAQLEQRVESRLFLEKCSCFQKQQGQTFCSVLVLWWHYNWKLAFRQPFLGFHQSSLWLLWLDIGLSLVAIYFQLFTTTPRTTYPHIHPCSAGDRSRLHHILFHRQRAISIFLGYFDSL